MRGKETVAAATALDHVSIQHVIRFPPVLARRFALGCEPHGVSPKVLRDMIRRIDQALPRMQYGFDNPNNGHTFHTYRIGKEYSRVLYVEVVKTYITKPFDYARLARQLTAWAMAAGAGEYDIVENSPAAFEFRVWWG